MDCTSIQCLQTGFHTTEWAFTLERRGSMACRARPRDVPDPAWKACRPPTEAKHSLRMMTSSTAPCTLGQNLSFSIFPRKCHVAVSRHPCRRQSLHMLFHNSLRLFENQCVYCHNPKNRVTDLLWPSGEGDSVPQRHIYQATRELLEGCQIGCGCFSSC